VKKKNQSNNGEATSVVSFQLSVPRKRALCLVVAPFNAADLDVSSRTVWGSRHNAK
jgi:hypothetical protein